MAFAEQAAWALARRHSSAPQFARSLEWLLFTALEADADMGPKAAVRCVAACPLQAQPRHPTLQHLNLHFAPEDDEQTSRSFRAAAAAVLLCYPSCCQCTAGGHPTVPCCLFVKHQFRRQWSSPAATLNVADA